jgi:TrmH family RNA methyltransferase
MKPLKLNWRVVLVRPRNPLNIGAVARALANFGIGEMAVVSPFEPTWNEARTSAVGGEKIIAGALTAATLADATRDATLVLGTTTGSRRNLGREIISLPDLAVWLRKRKARGQAVMVFGSEKTGLSNEDMTLCHALVRIPTAKDCPSMNLGQAVAVCLYELSRAGVITSEPAEINAHRSEPANHQMIEHTFANIVRVLDASGYFHSSSRAATLMKLRRTLLDMNLTCNDVRVLGGVLSQVGWKLEEGGATGQ